MESKMTEMVNMMMRQQTDTKKEYIDAKREENAKHRNELRQMVPWSFHPLVSYLNLPYPFLSYPFLSYLSFFPFLYYHLA